MSTVRLIIGDVRQVMSQMIADGDTFDQLITSPPFLALRSYLPADHPDKAREIGSEPTPATFLSTLYGLTADWGRLLPEWASICVELGDTMSGSGGGGGDYLPGGFRDGQPGFGGSAERQRDGNAAHWRHKQAQRDAWPLAKSMCILPHAYTLGLAYGHNPLTGQPTPAGQWRIRNVITWARPNPPVGSLGKRNPVKRTGDYKFRPACSYITVACRGTGRYFDLDAVRTEDGRAPSPRAPEPKALELEANGHHGKGMPATGTYHANGGAPPLDWHTDHLDGDWLWKLATAPYPGAHYATYPLTLPRRLILAMCPSEVCIVCGWPRERVTGQTNDEYAAIKRLSLEQAGTRRIGSEANDDLGVGYTKGSGNKAASMIQNGVVKPEYTTLGFTDCGCAVTPNGHNGSAGPGSSCRQGVSSAASAGSTPGPANYRPGRVLDPFGGSGTTAVAAALEGRDCTLIDLDPRNVELVRRRLTEILLIHDEHRDGDVYTWQVSAEPDSVLRAVATGQLSLFAEGLGA